MARTGSAQVLTDQPFSPHARGWPGERPGAHGGHHGSPRTRGDGPELRVVCETTAAVLPARAGMARRSTRAAPASPSFSPHARGWPGRLRRTGIRHVPFSPHARGWPELSQEDPLCHPVLPARAGMARLRLRPRPHGRPFSPHARGWPGSAVRWFACTISSPRTRGDGPDLQFHPSGRVVGSPRTRGDGPGVMGGGRYFSAVLPARAGMARARARAKASR